jgi:hypothetical protein
MKKLLFASLLIMMYSYESLFSYDFYLKIYYLHGEKSKDSHTSEELVTIKGNNVTYSITYTGIRGENDIDMEKSCTFSNNNIDNQNTIIPRV